MEISDRTGTISPQKVIDAGPTRLTLIAESPEILRALRLSYQKGVQYSLYLAVASVAVAAPFAVAMEWKTLRASRQEEVGVGISVDEEEKRMA